MPRNWCIAKGKVHKRYEFGCKVVLVTASNWIVSIDAVHGNPMTDDVEGCPEPNRKLTTIAPSKHL